MREISWDLRFYREKCDIIENCGSQNELILPAKRRPLKRIQAWIKQSIGARRARKTLQIKNRGEPFPDSD
jgi:hypothetical protein